MRALIALGLFLMPSASGQNSSCTPDAVLGPLEGDMPELYAFLTLFVLNALSGTFSGLNLGLMSLTEDDLNVIIEGSEDKKEVRWAKKILPLRKSGNLLLCTLLIGNTLVNVMLTLLTEPIWTWLFGAGNIGFIFGMLVPTALIVIFGEIIPQAYCGRNSLFVGAVSVPLVWCFVIVLYPLTKPIALLLDRMLGREISNILSRQMLLQLVNLNVNDAEHSKKSGLTIEDGKLLKGALTFKDRNVGDVMTPLSHCYFLSEDAVLDKGVIMDILTHGHTRVPVYRGEKQNVIAILFCKDLLGIGFERAQPLRDVLSSFGADVRDVRVAKSTTLNICMDYCKRKRTHLLLVCDDALAKSASMKNVVDGETAEKAMGHLDARDAPVIGLATMEDFLEELIQDEIVDETDAWFYERTDTRKEGEKSPLAAPVKKEVVQNKGVDLTAHLRSLTAPAQAPWAASPFAA